MGGGEQGGVVGFGQAAPFPATAPVHRRSGSTGAHGARLGRPAARRWRCGPSPSRTPAPTGVCPRRPQVRARGGRRVCPASSSKTIHAPCAAANLVSSPTCRPARPRWRPRRVRSPAAAGSAGPADAVQQVGHPARGVGHPEQPPDQESDPGQGPALIDPAVRGGTAVEFGDQPVELGVIQLAHRPTRAARRQRRPAPDGPSPPPGPNRFRGHPQPGGDLGRAHDPARTAPRPAHAPAPGQRVAGRSGHHHLRTSCIGSAWPRTSTTATHRIRFRRAFASRRAEAHPGRASATQRPARAQPAAPSGSRCRCSPPTRCPRRVRARGDLR